MQHALTRRRFLAQSGGVAAGIGLAATLPAGALTEDSTTSWPVTCRDAMLRHTGQIDSWSALAAVGADGLEVAVNPDLSLPGLFHPEQSYSAADDESRAVLAAACKQAGCRITALAMFNRFDERPEEEIDACVRTARAAHALGILAIRIDVVPRQIAREEFLPFAVRTLSAVMEQTEETGVQFAIENHGNTTNDPEFLAALFEGVGSPRLGLTLDTGNFYWFGHPLSKLYEIYEQFAPRAFHTHCKSINYPAEQRDKQRPMGWEYGKYHVPIDRGDIDFARLIAILRRAGYSNDLCVENEMLGRLEPAEATATLAGEIRMLRELQQST